MQHVANIQNNLSTQPIQQVNETHVQEITQSKTDIVAEQSEPIIADANLTEEKNVSENVDKITIGEIEQQKLKCPKCNGDLVLRTASRGVNSGKQFYGCSNFPKCKYIQNI